MSEHSVVVSIKDRRSDDPRACPMLSCARGLDTVVVAFASLPPRLPQDGQARIVSPLTFTSIVTPVDVTHATYALTVATVRILRGVTRFVSFTLIQYMATYIYTLSFNARCIIPLLSARMCLAWFAAALALSERAGDSNFILPKRMQPISEVEPP